MKNISMEIEDDALADVSGGEDIGFTVIPLPFALIETGGSIMENMELKHLEINDDQLEQASGGTEDDGWYWGYGFPPDYLNACPRCGGGVYSIPASAEQGGNTYHCGPCGWVGRSVEEFALGYTNN